jgi:hypothetical protein
MPPQTEILKQIDAVLKGCEDLRSRTNDPNFNSLPMVEVTSVVTLMRDCVQRLAPPNSQYVQTYAYVC